MSHLHFPDHAVHIVVDRVNVHHTDSDTDYNHSAGEDNTLAPEEDNVVVDHIRPAGMAGRFVVAAAKEVEGLVISSRPRHRPKRLD